MQAEFQLVKIIANQFAIFEDNYRDSDKGMDILTTINAGYDIENQAIAIKLDVEFQQLEKVVIKVVISHFYLLENKYFNTLKINDSQAILPKDLIIHLAMLTVGTLRGYLYSKLENTSLAEIYLPLLDITQLVKENITVTIKKAD